LINWEQKNLSKDALASTLDLEIFLKEAKLPLLKNSIFS
jgi:hypothetical protein